jgi:hypothetical protein
MSAIRLLGEHLREAQVVAVGIEQRDVVLPASRRVHVEYARLQRLDVILTEEIRLTLEIQTAVEREDRHRAHDAGTAVFDQIGLVEVVARVVNTDLRGDVEPRALDRQRQLRIQHETAAGGEHPHAVADQILLGVVELGVLPLEDEGRAARQSCAIGTERQPRQHTVRLVAYVFLVGQRLVAPPQRGRRPPVRAFVFQPPFAQQIDLGGHRDA